MKQIESFRYPRARMDALSDGIFSVAMTLLVLDIRLPEDFRPNEDAQLLAGLLQLLPKFLPYLLSFYVLGARWLAGVRMRGGHETLGGSYIRWWLFHLLLVTFVPFTAIVVGRYASLAPAVWLYAGNTALIAIASWRVLTLTPGIEDDYHRHKGRISMIVLLVSALCCIGWSFVRPSEALWFFTLNLTAPLIARHTMKSSREKEQ
jgi:uncharacterized membrane protein